MQREVKHPCTWLARTASSGAPAPQLPSRTMGTCPPGAPGGAGPEPRWAACVPSSQSWPPSLAQSPACKGGGCSEEDSGGIPQQTRARHLGPHGPPPDPGSWCKPMDGEAAPGIRQPTCPPPSHLGMFSSENRLIGPISFSSFLGTFCWAKRKSSRCSGEPNTEFKSGLRTLGRISCSMVSGTWQGETGCGWEAPSWHPLSLLLRGEPFGPCSTSQASPQGPWHSYSLRRDSHNPPCQATESPEEIS